MILSCNLMTRHINTYLVFSAFTSGTTFLLACNNVYVCLYDICFHPINYQHRSENESHSIPIPVFLELLNGVF
jgi:hypothetical protein